MSKPVACVVFEGALVDQFDAPLGIAGPFRPGVRERMQDLHKTHTIFIVSALTATETGVRLLFARLYEEDIPFDELWVGNALPACDVRYDNKAQKL